MSSASSILSAALVFKPLPCLASAKRGKTRTRSTTHSTWNSGLMRCHRFDNGARAHGVVSAKHIRVRICIIHEYMAYTTAI